MKYRLSPKVAGIAITGTVLSVALWFGVLPDLEEARALGGPGEIVFPVKKPGEGAGEKNRVKTSFSDGNTALAVGELWDEGWDNFMRWKLNPWRNRSESFPDDLLHKLLASKDPADVAKARDLQRRAEFWLKKLMERYPELAIEPKHVPDERNGFLKWLEFSERMEAAGPKSGPTFGLAEAFQSYLREKGPWDAQAVSDWLKANAAVMDEIRAIGLLPDASNEGIAVDRYGFMSARLAKECTDALLMEARLAAENGDVTAAMESVRAARGLGSHLENVESASLLQVTVRVLIQLDIEQRVFSEILPALPEGSRDPSAWEAVVRPEVKPPSDYARMMKGEWSITLREYVLPAILAPGDNRGIPDPGALLDAYTRPFAELARNAADLKHGEDPPGGFSEAPQTAGLSRRSSQIMEILFVGSRAWHKGGYRAANAHGLAIAAFSVMKDGTVPVDPIRGLPYRWDSATRTLSMPATPEFDEMNIKPVVVPKR